MLIQILTILIHEPLIFHYFLKHLSREYLSFSIDHCIIDMMRTTGALCNIFLNADTIIHVNACVSSRVDYCDFRFSTKNTKVVHNTASRHYMNSIPLLFFCDITFLTDSFITHHLPFSVERKWRCTSTHTCCTVPLWYFSWVKKTQLRILGERMSASRPLLDTHTHTHDALSGMGRARRGSILRFKKDTEKIKAD